MKRVKRCTTIGCETAYQESDESCPICKNKYFTLEQTRPPKKETPTPKTNNSNPNLTACSTCGKEIALSAKKCPHCGGMGPVEENEQWASLGVVIVFVLFFLWVFLFN